MIIKPYIPKPKFSKLKIGDKIKLEEADKYYFTIKKINKSSKLVMVNDMEGWFKCRYFWINMENDH